MMTGMIMVMVAVIKYHQSLFPGQNRLTPWTWVSIQSLDREVHSEEWHSGPVGLPTSFSLYT